MCPIDLRSDTITRPSPEMRKAIANAEVGDDVFRDDPTVLKLEGLVSEMFGKEAALYVPSGTMGNQVALKTISEPGWEIICERECHIINYETAGPVMHSQLLVNMLTTEYGFITAEQVEGQIRPKNIHCPITKIVSLENSHNRHGGTVYPIDEIYKIREVADRHGLIMHLDGARIWNSHIASGESLEKMTKPFDSVSICFSKGMGAPVGSMILGSKDLIEMCIRTRKLFGGGMRQAGIVAAGALYAVQNNLQRLAEDHACAKILAEGLAGIDYFNIDLVRVQTNIVIADIAETGLTSEEAVEKIAETGVLCVPFGATRVRFVTHLDVNEDDCKKAVEKISQIKF